MSDPNSKLRQSVRPAGQLLLFANAKPSAELQGDDALVALLAARLRRSQRAVLASALLASGSLRPLVEQETLAPGAAALRRARWQLSVLRVFGIEVVPVYELPKSLTAMDPPVCFFVRGDSGLLRRSAVGIVGSRRASRGPLRWAQEKASAAVAAGRLVVSGGAVGIDGMAHTTALDLGAPSLVYFGTPADRPTPSVHRVLFQRILRAGGALVSEHAPGEVTYAGDHAKRNRFIAAHAQTLFVAEAAEGSGSLGSARYANRCGTPIVVPPSPVGGERAGIDWLLRRGWAGTE